MAAQKKAGQGKGARDSRAPPDRRRGLEASATWKETWKKMEKCGGVLNIRIKSETYIFPRYICRLCPYLRNMDKYGYLVGYPARYQNLFDPWGLLSCGISGRSGSGTCRTVRHQENKLGSWRFISKYGNDVYLIYIISIF